MARQAIKSYAIDPAHTNDSHAIDRARHIILKVIIPDLNLDQPSICIFKGSVTVGYIFVYCRFISLFAKIQYG